MLTVVYVCTIGRSEGVFDIISSSESEAFLHYSMILKYLALRARPAQFRQSVGSKFILHVSDILFSTLTGGQSKSMSSVKRSRSATGKRANVLCSISRPNMCACAYV